MSSTGKPVRDVCGALVEKEGSVLMAQRNEGDDFGLQWEFPGGSVEEGESRTECIRRELLEELGIEVSVADLVGTFEDETPVRRVRIHLFRCRVTAGKPRPLQCREVRWVRFEEIGKLDLASADRKIYECLKARHAQDPDQ